MASGSNALLCLFHPAQLEHSQTASLGGRRAVADVGGGSHVDERLQFIVQIGLGPLPIDDPANETRFHRSRCCSSCRLPEAVSLI